MNVSFHVFKACGLFISETDHMRKARGYVLQRCNMHFAFHSELTVVEPINQGSGIKLISVCLLRRHSSEPKEARDVFGIERFPCPRDYLSNPS
jgi:hypothetical protein